MADVEIDVDQLGHGELKLNGEEIGRLISALTLRIDPKHGVRLELQLDWVSLFGTLEAAHVQVDAKTRLLLEWCGWTAPE